MLMQISLIRHAKTQGNLERRYIGRTDEPLCLSGREELERWISERRYLKCEVLFTSPMQRCLETAALIYPDIKPRVWEGLHECDFGFFEGKTYEELKDSSCYQQFLDQNGEGPIPGGEDSEAFRARCCKAFRDILQTAEQEKTQKLSIICHGGTIMALMSRFCENFGSFYDYQVPNCGGYLTEFDCQKMKFTSYKAL